jgi:hypothetical protein
VLGGNICEMHCTVLPESDDICDWRVFPFCKGDNFSRTRNLSFRIRSAKDNSSTRRIKILHRRQTKNILHRRQTKKSLHRRQTKNLYMEDKPKNLYIEVKPKIFTWKTNKKSLYRRQTKNLEKEYKQKIFTSKTNKKSLHRRQTKNIVVSKFSFQRLQLHLNRSFSPSPFLQIVVSNNSVVVTNWVTN